MMSPGSKVVITEKQRCQRRYKGHTGTVLDSTRSLARPYPMVYFVQLDELDLRAWFAEDQLALQAIMLEEMSA